MGLAAVSTAGGVLFADFVGADLIVRSGLAAAGASAFAVGAATKGIISVASYWGSTKADGMLAKTLFFVAIGSVASIGIDMWHWAKAYMGPGSETVSAAMGVPAPGAPAPARAPVGNRAETPSGEALGGF